MIPRLTVKVRVAMLPAVAVNSAVVQVFIANDERRQRGGITTCRILNTQIEVLVAAQPFGENGPQLSDRVAPLVHEPKLVLKTLEETIAVTSPIDSFDTKSPAAT
jgi:hypothetical protein